MGQHVILRCFFLALGQMGDARFRQVLVQGLLLTIGVLIAAYFAMSWLIGFFFGDGVVLPYFGEVQWVDEALGIGTFFLILAASVFLMIPVASAFTSLFLDQVAQAVEDRHYPNLPRPQLIPFGDALRDTLGFLGVLIGANLLALIVYLIVSPAAPFIFYALNGFLLGREYFTLAAMRRLGRAGAKALRVRHRGTIWLAGILMALPLTIPILNLIVPILGAATFTHLFHALQSEDQQRGTSTS
ncbi:MAG: EI24 domain-containing protein [Arenibacterium sp.]